MRRSTILFLAVIAVFVIGLISTSVYFTNKEINRGEEERSNMNMLNALIDNTNGQHKVINEELQGNVLVINVWATWCGPCIREIPELNILEEEFASDDIRFLAFDDLDSAKELSIMKEREIEFNYELYFNEKELIELLYSYKLPNENRAVPLNIVIDRKGKPAFYYMGYQKDKIDELRTYLENVNKASIKVDLL